VRCDAALSGMYLPKAQRDVTQPCLVGIYRSFREEFVYPIDGGSRFLWRSDRISLRRLPTVFWPTCCLYRMLGHSHLSTQQDKKNTH